MKISPIDIRQHTFEKGFRGYDIDEVDAFMNSLSQEWERVSNENKALKARLEVAENDLARMKDIEKTLYLTLKTAEETSQKITVQAKQEAEQRLQESASKSDALMNDAVQKANNLLKDAEQKASSIKETIILELANQEKDFKAIERHRIDLLDQLKSLVQTTNGIIEGFDSKFNQDATSSKMETLLREQLIYTPEEPINQYAYEVPEVEVEEEEEDQVITIQGEELAHEVLVEESQVVVPTDDERLETMIAEEDAEEPIVLVDETSRIEINTDPKVDVADQALAEIQRIRASRVEETPEPVQPIEEIVEKKKVTGSFFDQIG